MGKARPILWMLVSVWHRCTISVDILGPKASRCFQAVCQRDSQDFCEHWAWCPLLPVRAMSLRLSPSKSPPVTLGFLWENYCLGNIRVCRTLWQVTLGGLGIDEELPLGNLNSSHTDFGVRGVSTGSNAQLQIITIEGYKDVDRSVLIMWHLLMPPIQCPLGCPLAQPTPVGTELPFWSCLSWCGISEKNTKSVIDPGHTVRG